MNDLEMVMLHTLSNIELENAILNDEYFYSNVSLCVIDAVWSLNSNYERQVRKVIQRYCDYFNVKRLRSDRSLMPAREEQEPLSMLVDKFEQLSVTKFVDDIFCNHQVTSAKSGILKGEAVLRFSKVLLNHNVMYIQDVAKIIRDSTFEKDIFSIPGQKSGLSLRYFYMLSGEDDFVKPDRMICRFVESALGRFVNEDEAEFLVIETAKNLTTRFPHITPRLLDNVIWKYQKDIK